MSGDLVRAHTTVGDLELTVLTDGTYLLDGGAMFGVVPKPLWEKRAPADAQNRILLGTNTVVVRTGRQTVAIETGIGNKLPENGRVQMYPCYSFEFHLILLTIDPDLGKQVIRRRATDPVDVRQTDLDALVEGNVDAGDASHLNLAFACGADSSRSRGPGRSGG